MKPWWIMEMGCVWHAVICERRMKRTMIMLKKKREEKKVNREKKEKED
jgi:hypothetical protein